MSLEKQTKAELIKEINKLKRVIAKNNKLAVKAIDIDDRLEFYETLPFPIIIYNDKCVFFINTKAAKLLNVPKSSIKNISNYKATDFLTEESKAIIKQRNKKLVKDKESEEIEIKLKTLKNKEIFISTKSKIIQINNSNYYLSIFKDISERRSFEEKLKEVNNNFNLFLNSVGDVVSYIVFNSKENNKSEIKFVSGQIEKMFGISSADYIAKKYNLLDFVHPDDKAHIPTALLHVTNSKKPVNLVYRFKHKKTQKYFWVEDRIYPLVDNGKLIGLINLSKNITSEKDAEDRLKESEKRFRLIVENASDIIYSFSFVPEPQYTFVSKSVINILGYAPHDFYKNPFLGYQMVHPDDKKMVVDTSKINGDNTKSLKVPDVLAVRYITKNKEIKWLETKYSYSRDGEGNILSIEGISRDVTQLKQAEEKLKNSEQKFRLLTENANDIIFKFSYLPEVKYTYISPSVEKILGYKQEDFYNDPLFGTKIAINDTDTALLSTTKRITKGERKNVIPDVLVLKYRHKNGNVVWLETRYSQIRSAEGELLELDGISRDITEIKEAQLNLEKTQLSFSNLLSNLPGMAYRCLNDENWTMEFISDGCEEITGYQPIDIINNKKFSYASIIHPDDRHLGIPEINKALKGKTTFEIEYRIIDKDKRIKWVWEKGQGVYNNNKLLYIEGFITDITQRKLFEDQINQKWLNYKNVIDHSPQGIVIYNPEGKILFANHNALEIAGYSTFEEFSKKNIFKVLLPEYVPISSDRVKRAAQGEDLDFINVKIYTQSGKVTDIEVKSVPVIFDGVPVIQTIVNDISEKVLLQRQTQRALLAEHTNEVLQQEIESRKVAEYQLQQAQNYLRLLIESSYDLIIATDIEGNLTEFNAAAQKAYGYSASEVIGKNINMLYWDSGDKDLIEKTLLETNSFNGEVKCRHKNGSQFIIYLSATQLRNGKGELIGGMGISRDITQLKKDEAFLRENEEKFRVIYDQAFVGIARIDIKTGFFIDVNERLCSMLGYSPEEMFKLTITDLTHPDDNYDPKEVSKSDSIENYITQKRYLHKDGKEIYLNISYSLLKDEKGKPLYFIVIYDDLTEIKKHEQELVNKTSKLQAIFESGTQIFWTVDKEFVFTSFNKEFIKTIEKIYGVTPELNGRLEDISEEYKRLNVHDFWYEKYKQVFEGKSLDFVSERILKNGTHEYRQIYMRPIYNENNQIVEVSCIGYDVTELRFYEQQTLNQAEKLKAIFESGSQLIWSVNKNIAFTSFNQNYSDALFELYGYRPEINKDLSKPRALYAEKDYHDFWEEKYKKVFAGKSIEFVTERQNKNGEKVYRQIYLHPIYNKNNEVIEVSGMAYDITQSRIIEEQVRQSLKEKEVLLKEVHHRVKNNLQVISSILNLQTSYLKDEKIINILRECQNRIKSMAFIHESLYQTKDFTEINFSEYLISLSKNLLYSYITNQNRIKLRFDVETIFLNLDLSIPCGLIVNELISNSLKYAFPNNKEGYIFVELKKIDNQVTLSVSDNGIGIPNEIDINNTESLGLQLVISLAEQLNAEVEHTRTNGFKLKITFNTNQPKIYN